MGEKRALPFETTMGFAALPTAAILIYTKHPKFNAYAMNVYLYLLSRHNEKYGYAFPSIDEIACTLHISDSTVKRAIGALKDLGLIRVEPNSAFNNNVYYFNNPIESEAELYARFPEVRENEAKHEEKWAKISMRRKADKQKYMEKQAQAKPKAPVEIEKEQELVEEIDDIIAYF